MSKVRNDNKANLDIRSKYISTGHRVQIEAL